MCLHMNLQLQCLVAELLKLNQLPHVWIVQFHFILVFEADDATSKLLVAHILAFVVWSQMMRGGFAMRGAII